MSENVTAFYTLHLLSIIQTMHSCGFIHSHLHPRCLLVRHSEALDATVSAFGASAAWTEWALSEPSSSALEHCGGMWLQGGWGGKGTIP
jgi:serine/threonine protein kinase